MANIAKLPDGIAIATALPAGQVAASRRLGYGPHCATSVELRSPGRVATLLRKDAVVLAEVEEHGFIAQVSLGDLDPVTVPYVNRFLAGTTKVVIKDWRTGDYRLKPRKGGPKVQHVAQQPVITLTVPVSDEPTETQHTVAPVIEDDAEDKAAMVAHSESKAAVITVSSDEVATHGIPGMQVLPKVTLKGAGRGHTDVGGIIIPTTDLNTLTDAWKLRSMGKPAAVLLTGPAGTAKTMLVRSFAASLGVPYLKVDAGAIRTADDWAGAFRQDANTKTWAHRWSPFAMALRAGLPCILHVDELTRTESPAALNAFMGLLDESGTLLVPDANAVLTMPKGILVVATANIGPEFVGTLPLDGAVRQRFPYGVRMAYPAEATEAKLLVSRTKVSQDIAERLVRMATQQRMHRDDAQQYPSGAVISTRVLLSIADRIAIGAEPRSAVVATLHGQFDPGDDAALSVVIDSQFPKGATYGGPAEAAAKPATITAERHWFNQDPKGTDLCSYPMSDGTQCLNLSASPVHFGGK